MSKPFDPYHVWLGIPPEHRPPTHYQLLGVAVDEDDREVIQAAVLRLSAYVRTFQMGKHAEHANRILTELAEAKGCLLDTASRARYDAALAPAPPVTAPIARASAAALPPTIEMDEWIVGEYTAPLARPRAAMAPPRRRVAHLAPRTKPSPIAWLLPVAVGLLAIVVVGIVALRRKTADAPLTLDGKFVAAAPVPSTTQTSPPLTPAPQTLWPPPQTGGSTPTPFAPPTIIERPPVDEPRSPGPSIGDAPSAPPEPPAELPPTGTGNNTSAAPGGDVETPVERPAKPVSAAARRPAPTGAALSSARKQVNSAFAKDFRRAQTLDQRLDAVHRLYDESQLAEQTALRYAYLEECRDRAVNMSEPGLAFQALEEMGRLFEVETGPLKLDALRSSLEKSRKPEQVYTVAMLALGARNRASTADKALSEQFGALAAAAGRKVGLSAIGLTGGIRIAPRRSRFSGGLAELGAPQPGLTATVFAGNDFQKELLRRVDRHIDFHFGLGSADPSLPADRFSIRWTGWLTPPLPGKYIITVSASGAARVKIGDQTLTESRQIGRRGINFGVSLALNQRQEVDLTGPQAIAVEFSDRVLPGGIRLRWSLKERSTEHTIPAEAFSHNVP